MTWIWVLLACGIAYLTKLVGYLLPSSWLDRPIVANVTAAVTAGLLASLIVVNALSDGNKIVFDARIIAVVVAVFLAWRRAPFLLIVVVAAAATAIARLAGLA